MRRVLFCFSCSCFPSSLFFFFNWNATIRVQWNRRKRTHTHTHSVSLWVSSVVLFLFLFPSLLFLISFLYFILFYFCWERERCWTSSFAIACHRRKWDFRFVPFLFFFVFILAFSFVLFSFRKKKIIVLLCAGENAMIVEKSSAFLFPISRVSLRVSFFFLYCSALLPLTMFGYLRKNLPRNPVKPSKTQ